MLGDSELLLHVRAGLPACPWAMEMGKADCNRMQASSEANALCARGNGGKLDNAGNVKSDWI